MRSVFVFSTIIVVLGTLVLNLYLPVTLVLWAVWLPLLLLGYIDFFQTKQTIRRNFPLLGRIRYLFELIRPEINQYFVESNSDGVPFSREQRSVVYQRAKKELDTLPFGTQMNVYAEGYEWVNHSLAPLHVDPTTLRMTVGGKDCKRPYSASILNISAMSYGSLSKNAVLALNGGAKDGGFAHNTGEGGLSPYHLENGGDLIWQIGTGYFSARTKDGQFDPGMFAERAVQSQVKMIEIKLSQGAKPGHGGILPASKVTKEIAQIRLVPMGQDVISPPAHSAFSTPIEMLHFVAKLRELSGGKPVGIKLCVGKRREFFALCKAMISTGILPDYISVDGGEGGTGAAPLEFSNFVGTPGVEGLVFVHNALVGFGLRDQLRVFTSGKVTTSFDIIKRIAIGADVVYSARGMLLALGCIQALRCHSNHCPTGITTQDPQLVAGLHVPSKRTRIKNFHHETLKTFAEVIGAMGLEHSRDLKPWHIMRRTSPESIRHYGEMFRYLQPGELLQKDLPPEYRRAVEAASPDTFRYVGA